MTALELAVHFNNAQAIAILRNFSQTVAKTCKAQLLSDGASKRTTTMSAQKELEFGEGETFRRSEEEEEGEEEEEEEEDYRVTGVTGSRWFAA